MNKKRKRLLLAVCIFTGMVIIVVNIYRYDSPQKETANMQENGTSGFEQDMFLTANETNEEDMGREDAVPEATIQMDEDWEIVPDFSEKVQGDNFWDTFTYEHDGNQIVEGGGCIYTTDMGLYSGEPKREHQQYTIYRLKDGEWDIFVSHPIETGEEVIVEGKSYHNNRNDIGNLIYYNGYIYYRLLKDPFPGEGTNKGPRAGYIYRISEYGGEPECLADCSNRFYIYRDRLYYRVWTQDEKVYYWEMGCDGEDKRLIYGSALNETAPNESDRFTVGGECLYLKQGDEGDILCIHLETGKAKELRFSMREKIKRIYYNNGYLYGWYYNRDESKDEMYQLDVTTGEEEKILEGDIGSIWVQDEWLYYIDTKKSEGGLSCLCYNRMDLKRKETATLVLLEDCFDGCSIRIEMLEKEIIVYVHIRTEDERYKTAYLRSSLEKAEDYSSWDIREKDIEHWSGW